MLNIRGYIYRKIGFNLGCWYEPHLLVSTTNKRGGDGVKGVDGGVVILATTSITPKFKILFCY